MCGVPSHSTVSQGMSWQEMQSVSWNLGLGARAGMHGCFHNQVDIRGCSSSGLCSWCPFLPGFLGVAPRGCELRVGHCPRRFSQQRWRPLCLLFDKKTSPCFLRTVCVTRSVPMAVIHLLDCVSWPSLSETERCQIGHPRSEFMV